MPSRKRAKTSSAIFKVQLTFPKSPKKAEERKALLDKVKAWIEEQKETSPFKKTETHRRMVYLEGDNSMFGVGFGKLMAARAAVIDPNLNLEAANELGNRVLAYVNVVLGERASGARVTTSLNKSSKRISRLPKALLGETRLAKLSEIAKKNLVVNGLIFSFDVDDRNVVSFVFGAKGMSTHYFGSSDKMESVIPLDLLKSEYAIFSKSEDVIERLRKGDI